MRMFGRLKRENQEEQHKRGIQREEGASIYGDDQNRKIKHR